MAQAFPFDSKLRRSLPEEHGIYRIFDPSEPHATVRAGRTKTAHGGLRQRIYQNHFMGAQPGNLRAQMVRAGVCPTLDHAKDFIRTNLRVQFLIRTDPEQRRWLEYVMLAALRPRFCD